MATGAIITAVLFTTLAAVHSVAGEIGFVRPLVAAEWQIVEVPRPIADKILRGAWHLTSLAWLAMAAIALGAAPIVTVSFLALASGGVMLARLPGHPAWPLFLVAGIGGLHAEGWLPGIVLGVAAALTVAALLGLAAVHLYWAMGGSMGNAAVIPTTADGAPTIRPTRGTTMAVAALLTTLGALVAVAATGAGPAVVAWLVGAGIVVLAARAIGDSSTVGFTKKQRGTAFAESDDRLYTPLTVLLAIGAAAALIV